MITLSHLDHLLYLNSFIIKNKIFIEILKFFYDKPYEE